jgi:hypothetical protein
MQGLVKQSPLSLRFVFVKFSFQIGLASQTPVQLYRPAGLCGLAVLTWWWLQELAHACASGVSWLACVVLVLSSVHWC